MTIVGIGIVRVAGADVNVAGIHQDALILRVAQPQIDNGFHVGTVAGQEFLAGAQGVAGARHAPLWP